MFRGLSSRFSVWGSGFKVVVTTSEGGWLRLDSAAGVNVTRLGCKTSPQICDNQGPSRVSVVISEFCAGKSIPNTVSTSSAITYGKGFGSSKRILDRTPIGAP